MITGPRELSYKASQTPDRLDYEVILPYRRWMDGATLTLRRADYGCCATLLARQDSPLATFRDRKPDYMPLAAYVQPQVEAVKARALTGTAYIDFPVNQTDIRPDRPRHHHHRPQHQGLRLARRQLRAERPPGRRPHRGLETICVAPLPL